MRKIALLLALLSSVVLVDSVHAARSSKAKAKKPRAKALADVCPKIQDVGNATSTIYKNSAPVRANSNFTAPIVGYRKEPTLIMNRNISTRGTKPIYDGKGKAIGSCPWASAHDHAGGRYRCTMQTSSLRRSAVRNTNSPTVYFKINSNTCIKVGDAGKCYGSVKGLCNQTIK